jgi:hypothetical protein
MTLQEAIALRKKQLNGQPVDQFMLEVALRTIQDAAVAARKARVCGKSAEILRLLASTGAVDREEFYRVAREHRAYMEVRKLAVRGLIKCEVRLTERGLRALGLEGPTL